MTTTNAAVANEIKRQLGGAIFMFGARLLVYDEKSLAFSIRGSRKANKVKITLEPSDTYRVECFKIRGTDCRKVSEANMVYADSLKPVLEAHTGLAASL